QVGGPGAGGGDAGRNQGGRGGIRGIDAALPPLNWRVKSAGSRLRVLGASRTRCCRPSGNGLACSSRARCASADACRSARLPMLEIIALIVLLGKIGDMARRRGRSPSKFGLL